MTGPADQPVRRTAEAAIGSPTPPVSVLILTLDEEINIGPCLASCAWCDDVHVLDCGSTDGTRRIAEELGAQVHNHPFESFGRQRNWAIDNIPMTHEWVFHLDADERFTQPLVNAVAGLLAREPVEAGFHLPSKLIFMGRWLKRAGGYPTYQMRLFHKQRMRFCDHGHGQREETAGRVGTLDEPYLHYNFSKGLHHWFERHNNYSTLEAEQALAESGEPVSMGALWGGDRIARRRAIKRLSRKLPFRPTLRWAYTMFIQGAALEGRPGRIYARLLAMYEKMIAVKMIELEHARSSAERSSNR